MDLGGSISPYIATPVALNAGVWGLASLVVNNFVVFAGGLYAFLCRLSHVSSLANRALQFVK